MTDKLKTSVYNSDPVQKAPVGSGTPGHLPIFVTLPAPVLIVGGGETALRKARLLLGLGAQVTLVHPDIDAGLAALVQASGKVHRRAFTKADLQGHALIFAAQGDAGSDEHVAQAARDAGIPVNVVDRPDLCSFIMPAIIDRRPITIAISSGGTAPVLVRQIREKLEALFPARLGRLARFAGDFRRAVKANIREPVERRRFWERFFRGPVADAVLAGRDVEANERMLALVNRPALQDGGIVHIVGAGPGDPDLLTFRALRVMQQCDVVIYDKLVGAEVLDYVRRDALRIFVGKTKACHTLSQDGINALLVEHAMAGRRVVRLKGGDPFVFGRGGEEVEFLRARNIPVEVVPGITAATGVTAAAGIPLTHRDHAMAVTFITGHAKDGDPDLDWTLLAKSRHTLVVYMGLSKADTIAGKLIAHGMAPDMPAAIIENGTRVDQRVSIGTVGEIGNIARVEGFTGPALIVIGDVVRVAPAESLPAYVQAIAV